MSSGAVHTFSNDSDACAIADVRSTVPSGRLPDASVRKMCSRPASSLRQGLDLPAIKRLGGDESLSIADCHARLNRLRSERGKKRREHASIFERAKGVDVKLRYAAEQREDSIPLGHVALGKDIGKPIHCRSERGVAEVSDSIVAPDPAQGEPVAATGSDVSVDRLVGDIEPAARQLVEQRPDLRPRERPGMLLVIQEIGADTVVSPLVDSLPFHIEALGKPRVIEDVHSSNPGASRSSNSILSIIAECLPTGFLFRSRPASCSVMSSPFLRHSVSLHVVPCHFHVACGAACWMPRKDARDDILITARHLALRPQIEGQSSSSAS
jgi:hypothetical protein